MFLKNFSIEANAHIQSLSLRDYSPALWTAHCRALQGSAHHVLEPEESAQGLLEALNSLDTTSGIAIDWKGVSFEP